MNSIRKGFKPQTLLITDKDDNIVGNNSESLRKVVWILWETLWTARWNAQVQCRRVDNVDI